MGGVILTVLTTSFLSQHNPEKKTAHLRFSWQFCKMDVDVDSDPSSPTGARNAKNVQTSGFLAKECVRAVAGVGAGSKTLKTSSQTDSEREKHSLLIKE